MASWRAAAGVLFLLLAGCAAPTPPTDGQPAPLTCIHPWPCADGTEWPAALTGPFELASLERVEVESHDGVLLNGWVMLPDTPAGQRLPAVLHSTPYDGQTRDAPGNGDFWSHESPGVPFERLIQEGYALVVFQVRGTGASGGCYEILGPNEQRDQALLVDWVANQSWSNGRVGMAGLSYHGGTPFEAAIHAPPALKTIVVAGVITDVYTMFHTPQGALRNLGTEQAIPVSSTGPPGADAADEGAAEDWLPHAGERACPEVVEALAASTRDALVDERAPAFWSARHLVGGLPNLTAAVLLTAGFHDDRLHGYQDDPVWGALPAATPRAFVMGQWSHEWPTTNHFREDWIVADWHEREIRWLDFWLKGIGAPPPEIGTAEYQDDAGVWHTSTAWPPSEAIPRALYLAGETLAAAPGSASRSFLAAPDPAGSAAADETIGYTDGESPGPVCPDALASLGVAPRFAAFVSDPMDSETLVAGRAFAALTLRSSEEGGIIHATLLDLAPDFACDERGTPTGARWLSGGEADLRYHAGGYVAEPFPVGAPTFVRIDLLDLAGSVPAGHRIALVLSAGDATFARHNLDGLASVAGKDATHDSRPYGPMITIDPESHFILPLQKSEMGAPPLLLAYPPRPFSGVG